MQSTQYECPRCRLTFAVKSLEAPPVPQPVCPGCGEEQVAPSPAPGCKMECANGGECGCSVPGFA